MRNYPGSSVSAVRIRRDGVMNIIYFLIIYTMATADVLSRRRLVLDQSTPQSMRFWTRIHQRNRQAAQTLPKAS